MRPKNKPKLPVKKAKLVNHAKKLGTLAKNKAMVVAADVEIMDDIIMQVLAHEGRLMALEARVLERGEKGAKGDIGERGMEGQRGPKGGGWFS